MVSRLLLNKASVAAACTYDIILSTYLKKSVFVWSPLHFVTLLILFGMLKISFLQYSTSKFFTQTSFMACCSTKKLKGCYSATFLFVVDNQFSIGLRSGLFPGHSSMLILCWSRKLCTILDRWHEAPSCINTEQWWTAMCNCNFSRRRFTYREPFIVTSAGKKYSAAVPLTDIAPQIIWQVGCFTVGIVYFSSNCFPLGLPTGFFCTTNCWKVD